jgi:hypothetical protein
MQNPNQLLSGRAGIGKKAFSKIGGEAVEATAWQCLNRKLHPYRRKP